MPFLVWGVGVRGGMSPAVCGGRWCERGPPCPVPGLTSGSVPVLAPCDESPAPLLICVNQTTFKGAFVRSLEHQAGASAPLRQPGLSSGDRGCALRGLLFFPFQPSPAGCWL